MIQLLAVAKTTQLRRDIARLLLSAPHIKATFVDSFEDATAYLTEHKPDILLTSYRIGEMTACDLTEQLCDLAPHTRSVVIHDAADGSEDLQRISFACLNHLTLPLSQQLISVLEAVHQDKVSAYHTREFSLLDLLQLFHQMKSNDTIVFHGDYPGIIQLKDGEIVHAQTSDVTGEYALQVLLHVSPCWIRTSPHKGKTQHTIKKPFQRLIFSLLPDDDSPPESAQEPEEETLFFSFGKPDSEGEALFKGEELLEVNESNDGFIDEDWATELDDSSWSDIDVELVDFTADNHAHNEVQWHRDRDKTALREQSFRQLPKLKLPDSELHDLRVDELTDDETTIERAPEADAATPTQTAPAAVEADAATPTQAAPVVVEADAVTPTQAQASAPQLDPATASALKRWLNKKIAEIPQCAVAASIDLSHQTLLALRSDDPDVSKDTDTMVAFASSMFEASANASIESSTCDGDRASCSREIIAFSDGLLYILARGKTHPLLALVYVCRARENFGFSLIKARTSVADFESTFKDTLEPIFTDPPS